MDDVLPSVARAADLTAQEQRLWSTDPAYAAAHAQALVTAAAGSLPATMTLLSDAGVRIVDDDSKKVILDARGPQRLQTQINAGQVRAFHGLLAKQGTFSLTDLMDLASAATGTSGQVPVRYVAAGIEADLTDPTRHPVWAALVRGSGAHDLLPALHTVAQGGHVQSEHVEMTSTQLFMLALRMRAEFAATLRIVAKMKHPPATPSPGPHAAPLAPQTSGSTHRGVSPPISDVAFAVPADSASSLPCKFDNPVVDAVIGDLLKEGNRWGVRWTFGGSDAPIWKGEPELGTGKDLAKLLGVLTFWSTLVNIVLVKALTDIEISVAPSPLQRTKTTVKGQEGIAQAHVHMTAGPSGKYQRCVELVAAAAGITVTAQAPRDLAGTAVTWSLDGGNASPLILSNDKNEWTSVADDHGVDRTSIYGRSQATDLDAAALPVLKNAGVTAAVNPDTADSMWKTTWKAVVDAWNFGNAVGIGPTRSVNPISIGNSILKAALRALNHFGWLSARADIPVRDWGYPTLRWTIKMGQYLLTHYDNPDMTTADSRGIFTLTGKAPLQPLAEGGLAFAYAADTSLLRNASTINGACGHVQTLGLCNISEKLVATHAGQLRISQVHLDAHQFPVAVTASIAHMPSLTLTTTCTGTCGPDASGTGTGGGLAQEILNRFFPDSPDVTIKGFTRDPRSGNFVSTMDVKQDLGDAFNVGNSSIHAVWTIEGLTSP